LHLLKPFTELLKEVVLIALDLYKILIPVIILVKILSEFGAIEVFGTILSPIMSLMGLPGEMGLVWAVAIVTNLYGAIAALIAIYPEGGLSIAQITVLSSIMLICHALPVELALCNKVGASFRLLGPIRFFGAMIFGVIYYHLSAFFEPLSHEASILWVEQRVEESLADWALNQLLNLAFVFVVLFCLLLLMRILKKIGFTRLVVYLLSPALYLIGISKKAAPTAMFGLLAGITFGSGLLLAEAKESKLESRDIVLVLTFLSLCHGVIEDTTLMLLLGADLSGILIGRIIFAMIVVALMARLSDNTINKFATARKKS